MTTVVYESGDTIRAVATFRDWAPVGELGDIVDPTGVTVTVYDAEQTVVDKYIYGEDDELTSQVAGVYNFDFIIPDAGGSYFIEFNGELDGKPTIVRAKIKSKFDA